MFDHSGAGRVISVLCAGVFLTDEKKLMAQDIVAGRRFALHRNPWLMGTMSVMAAPRGVSGRILRKVAFVEFCDIDNFTCLSDIGLLAPRWSR
jgi:hypothetical protein